ncbi:MAG: ABC transporter permease [Pseudomonadota bacterium]
MAPAFVVFAKEVVDNLRDRRSIGMSMVYPLIGPILLGLLIAFVGGTIRGSPERRLDIAIHNGGGAPDLVDFLRRKGAQLYLAPADAAAAVRDGAVPFVLVIPDAPPLPNTPLEVQMVVDLGRLATVMPMSRTVDLLREYSVGIAAERLTEAGLPPQLVESVVVREFHVGRTRNLAAILLNVMPPFLMFTIFLGGVYLALDTTSGERERGSLEPLMINPVRRWEVLAGKLGAACVFTLVAVIVQVAAFAAMMKSISAEGAGLAEMPSLARMILLVGICVPLTLFAVVTQVVVAAGTRSLKEAQTYLGLLPLVPSLPGMILIFAPVQAHAVLAAIPTFGQTVLLGQLIRGDDVSLALVGVSAIATVIATMGLLYVAIRLYEREQLLFAGS